MSDQVQALIRKRHLMIGIRHFTDFPDSPPLEGDRALIFPGEVSLTEFRIDPLSPVKIEVRAESPAVFRFTAQYRVPGRDYMDFASARDSTHVGQSAYRTELPPPIQSYTDLRIYFLIDGAARHAYRIAVQCAQRGKPVGKPIICEGTIRRADAKPEQGPKPA